MLILLKNGAIFEVFPLLLSAIGFGLLLYSIGLLLKKIHTKLSAIVVVVLLLSTLFIRHLLGFLYDFSGQGFTSDFFAHIGLKSFEIGVGEYGARLLVLLIFFLFVAIVAFVLVSNHPDKPMRHGFLFLFGSFILIFLGVAGSPEILLTKAYARYSLVRKNHFSATDARKQSLHLLEPIRQSEFAPIDKNKLQASLPKDPVNLILVYLESFNEMLTGSKKYPGLTPHIDVLKKRFHTFSQNYSSAYVTIEGIANSQCGTLMNMDHANNSLTIRRGRLPMLPCLGDVLHKAGYQQIYLGGAGLEFAGKGGFFLDHGYDEVLGWKHWVKEGFKPLKNIWGLPDTKLFNEALKTIQLLRSQSTPFNVTMLTLGTHIPGYQYEGCPDYPGIKNEAFINAIHCTDFLLGKFVDQLENLGILQDTVLYIQADHGVPPKPILKRLFADDIEDRRILTLISTPEFIKNKLGTWHEDAPEASVNMVATLLEIMQIKHNADFIFARSHFDRGNSQSYQLTRYEDYTNGKKISNNPSDCMEQERSDPLSLPLDNCDKDRALQAVYVLDATYSMLAEENQVCKLAAEAYLTPASGRVHVRWGNHVLTDQFYGHGRKVKSFMRGIFLLILDNQEKILQQQFFSADSQEDLKRLNVVLNGQTQNHHLLLISNIAPNKLDPQIKILWPKQLLQNHLVYGHFVDEELVIDFVDKKYAFAKQFYPASCPDGIQQHEFVAPKPPEKTAFCKIIRWGPQTTYTGKRFNEQSNARSAFWFKTKCAPEYLVVRFSGKILDTVKRLPTITASFNADSYLQQSGQYDIELMDQETGEVVKVGLFQIFPSQNKKTPKKG